MSFNFSCRFYNQTRSVNGLNSKASYVCQVFVLL